MLCEDESQRSEARRARAGPRSDLRRPGRPARARACPCRRVIRSRRGGVGRDRRGRPLHVHLHVGHDRPAEGLHDHCHRNYYEMADEIRQMRRLHRSRTTLMLLYLPLAHNFGRLMHLHGPHVGYTIAFCPDPYAVAEALPAVRPTVFPSVPTRVREGAHRRHGEVRRGDRRQAQADRLGAARRSAG